MSKFSGKQVRRRPAAPQQVAGRAVPSGSGPIRIRPLPALPADTVTHEGGAAWTQDVKTALFNLAAINMVGENTFYETAGARDERFVDLIHQATVQDAAWVAAFIPFLRNKMNMRSASTVMAMEFAAAALSAKLAPTPSIRQVVDSALQRPDEPAEALAYWVATYGKKLSAPVKRGIADACRRLYTEQAALRYDGLSRDWRMGDVIELVHPRPRDDAQSALFRYLLDKRHNRTFEGGPPVVLPAIRARDELIRLTPNERHRFMRRVQQGGEATAKFELALARQWEWAKSWLGGQ